MSSEIIEPVYCDNCRRAVSPHDDFCRNCGKSLRGESATGRVPEYVPPPEPTPAATQNPPQVIVVTQPVPRMPPPTPSVGAVILKVFLTGMGVAGAIWLGCIGLILLGGVIVLAIILSGAGSH